MHSKYCRTDHPNQVRAKLGDSMTWKQMLKMKEQDENLYTWELGQCNINFWQDKWCPENTIEPLDENLDKNLMVKDYWEGQKWSQEVLQKVVTENSMRQKSKIQFDRNNKDRMIIKVNSTQSVTQAIYNQLFTWEETSWGENLWNKFLSPSMDFFSWIVLNNLIPTDDILMLKSLKEPSKCYLYQNSDETATHLFFQCDFSRKVWGSLTINFHINTINLGWE
ncbi:uncharacterized protein LOC110033598 [Phalaenopsis equestris]|uniref:uncharacterized protein LOC110033598 n=1 Tax=Phalaenopsis equestris TaxID=78828 RepID=UPI0009E4E1AC|nr:uncharacterized protein LOC110033598 [Phalaenopsis equestris]